MTATPSDPMPAVFLDRDGVINVPVVTDGKPFPPATLADFRIIDGVAAAIVAFRDAGYRIIVATNQPDVATGKQDQAVVEAMHEKLKSELGVDDILVCYHTDEHACPCRKPKPGMLMEAQRKWNLDLTGSVMVGDRWRDIEAGQAVGCRTVFIDYGYAEKRPAAPDFIVKSLAESVALILPNHS